MIFALSLRVINLFVNSNIHYVSYFSEYKNVICLFNDDEAVESDIIDDFFVACLTPPSVPEVAVARWLLSPFCSTICS